MYPTTPVYELKQIRPVTEAEHARAMIAELFQRCDMSDIPAHMHMLRTLRDDTAATLNYCYQELTSIDDRGQRQDIADLRSA